MQNRMKTHQLTEAQIEGLLAKVITGCIATLNEDGTPYVVPIHFVYEKENNRVVFHGLPAGQKIENIKRSADVSFTAYEMDCFLYDDEGRPCETNTKYQSVVIAGKAKLIEDYDEKMKGLKAVVAKYTPQLSGRELPENMVKGTAVVEIKIESITGKYYA